MEVLSTFVLYDYVVAPRVACDSRHLPLRLTVTSDRYRYVALRHYTHVVTTDVPPPPPGVPGSPAAG